MRQKLEAALEAAEAVEEVPFLLRSRSQRHVPCPFLGQTPTETTAATQAATTAESHSKATSHAGSWCRLRDRYELARLEGFDGLSHGPTRSLVDRYSNGAQSLVGIRIDRAADGRLHTAIGHQLRRLNSGSSYSSHEGIRNRHVLQGIIVYKNELLHPPESWVHRRV